MNIEENIKQRKFFQEVLDFLNSESHQLSPRFWELMLNECKARLGLPPEQSKIKPFDEKQAREFERVMFSYGMMKGKTVMEASCSYLLWLAEGDDFIQSIRRYVASDHFARLQDMEMRSRDFDKETDI